MEKHASKDVDCAYAIIALATQPGFGTKAPDVVAAYRRDLLAEIRDAVLCSPKTTLKETVLKKLESLS